jgi:GH25 family lysozyme M1 (1,4-beta-N-acetylmuramidase)
MIMGCDVSSWQPSVDWATLHSKGIEFAIVKATQGSYLRDRLLTNHLAGANSAGLLTGAYHWLDPLSKDNEQADFFLKSISGLPVSFLVIDLEQYWADWQEWSLHNIHQTLDSERISNSARAVAERLKAQSALPVVIYSRASFIEQYAQPANAWLPNYPLWMAQYPYGATRVKCSWEEFLSTRLPKIAGPLLPPGCNQWRIWQFSGDKFILPGCDGTLDLDYFDGTLNDLRNFCVSSQQADMPGPQQADTQTLEAWAQSIDTWARRMGFTGARP